MTKIFPVENIPPRNIREGSSLRNLKLSLLSFTAFFYYSLNYFFLLINVILTRPSIQITKQVEKFEARLSPSSLQKYSVQGLKA